MDRFTNASSRSVDKLVEITDFSLSDRRVTVINTDAEQYVRAHAEARKPKYDVIIVDLPDPINTQISDLYSVEFYREVFQILDKEVWHMC